MPVLPQCPTPPGCSWKTQTLDGVQVYVCERCGQVRMDRSALARLTGSTEATARPSGLGPPGRMPTPVPPPLFGGAELDAPDPPQRPRRPPASSPADGPPPTSFEPARPPSITPGPPPQRPVTPRPTPARLHRQSREFSHTVVPFGAPPESRATPPSVPSYDDHPSETPEPSPRPVESRRRAVAEAPPRFATSRRLASAPTYIPLEEHDDEELPDLPRPPAPPAVHSVRPDSGTDDDVLSQRGDSELHAAPLPLAHDLEARERETWAPEDMPTTVDAGSARRSAIDDSRIPTDEAMPSPEPIRAHGQHGDGDLGLGAAVTRHDDPDLDLRAAVSGTDEPGLGFEQDPTEDAFLGEQTEEEERFFTEESEPLLGPGADVDDDVTWERRRSPLPMIAVGVVVVLLVVAVGGVAVVGLVPSVGESLGLRRAAGSSQEPPSPQDGPSIAEAVDPDEADADAAPAEALPPDPIPVAGGQADPGDPAATNPAAEVSTPDEASQATSDPTEPAAGAAGTPDPEPETAAAAEPAPDPEPAPAPEPEPVAATPAPAPPPSVDTLVTRGWNTVDTDPDAAADTFRAALDQRPGDVDASYGLGYAMLRLGQRNGAKAYLCAAARNADEVDKQEILGVASSNGIACDD